MQNKYTQEIYHIIITRKSDILYSRKLAGNKDRVYVFPIQVNSVNWVGIQQEGVGFLSCTW